MNQKITLLSTLKNKQDPSLINSIIELEKTASEIRAARRAELKQDLDKILLWEKLEKAKMIQKYSLARSEESKNIDFKLNSEKLFFYEGLRIDTKPLIYVNKEYISKQTGFVLVDYKEPESERRNCLVLKRRDVNLSLIIRPKWELILFADSGLCYSEGHSTLSLKFKYFKSIKAV